MDIVRYLPSTRLITMAASLLAATGLIIGAQYISKTPGPSSLASAPKSPTDANWEQTLQEIQLEAGVSAPTPPPANIVNTLLAEATSDNLTSTIGRTLLVNLSAANVQGLGNDIPTQDALIEAAAAQVSSGTTRPYTAREVITIAQTKESLHQYGNQLMSILVTYPGTNAGEILFAFGETLDYNDPSKLGPVKTAKSAYQNLATGLMQLPVPETLAPLHVQIANNLSLMGSAAGEMSTVLTDPLRGLSGIHNYQTASDEASRLLTVIAGTFKNNGIIFNEDEPGATWNVFVASP